MLPAVKTIIGILLPLGILILGLSNCATHGDWHQASRESANLAPLPETTQEAVVQVYGASAWSWRGWIAIHTWIAAKATGASHYRVYEVIGWRLKRTGSALRIAEDLPDRYWYGSRPELLKEHRGEGVDELIAKIDATARNYPWSKDYRVFPGPNSNTFTAWMAMKVPELQLELPWRAIGSGYAARAEQGTR